MRTVLLVVLCAGSAWADARQFTFSEQAVVLAPGERELEAWVSPRLGRDGFYALFEQWLELEAALSDKVMVGLHLELWHQTENEGGRFASRTTFGGATAEVKYLLHESLALRGTFTAAADAVGGEARVIYEKRFDQISLVANLAVAPRWTFVAPGEVENQWTGELTLGGAYWVNEHLSVGPEFRGATLVTFPQGLDHVGLFLGPTVAYTAPGWWVAASALSQLPTLKRPEGSSSPLDLVAFEKLHGRLAFALRL